jgi:hypothetical protein
MSSSRSATAVDVGQRRRDLEKRASEHAVHYEWKRDGKSCGESGWVTAHRLMVLNSLLIATRCVECSSMLPPTCRVRRGAYLATEARSRACRPASVRLATPKALQNVRAGQLSPSSTCSPSALMREHASAGTTPGCGSKEYSAGMRTASAQASEEDARRQGQTALPQPTGLQLLPLKQPLLPLCMIQAAR